MTTTMCRRGWYWLLASVAGVVAVDGGYAAEMMVFLLVEAANVVSMSFSHGFNVRVIRNSSVM